MKPNAFSRIVFALLFTTISSVIARHLESSQLHSNDVEQVKQSQFDIHDNGSPKTRMNLHDGTGSARHSDKRNDDGSKPRSDAGDPFLISRSEVSDSLIPRTESDYYGDVPSNDKELFPESNRPPGRAMTSKDTKDYKSSRQNDVDAAERDMDQVKRSQFDIHDNGSPMARMNLPGDGSSDAYAPFLISRSEISDSLIPRTESDYYGDVPSNDKELFPESDHHPGRPMTSKDTKDYKSSRQNDVDTAEREMPLDEIIAELMKIARNKRQS